MEWKAFELKAGTPPEGLPKPFKEGETAELRGHMKEAAEAAGLQRMKRQQIVPYTIPAFEGAEFAKAQGKFNKYHKAIFKSFWEESKNIGEKEVLQKVFEECDLDWEIFNEPEGKKRYREQVNDQLNQASIFGISGVPAFVLDRYLISGAQPYEVFQNVMEQIYKEQRQKGP